MVGFIVYDFLDFGFYINYKLGQNRQFQKLDLSWKITKKYFLAQTIFMVQFQADFIQDAAINEAFHWFWT